MRRYNKRSKTPQQSVSNKGRREHAEASDKEQVVQYVYPKCKPTGKVSKKDVAFAKRVGRLKKNIRYYWTGAVSPYLLFVQGVYNRDSNLQGWAYILINSNGHLISANYGGQQAQSLKGKHEHIRWRHTLQACLKAIKDGLKAAHDEDISMLDIQWSYEAVSGTDMMADFDDALEQYTSKGIDIGFVYKKTPTKKRYLSYLRICKALAYASADLRSPNRLSSLPEAWVDEIHQVRTDRQAELKAQAKQRQEALMEKGLRENMQRATVNDNNSKS